MVGATEGAEGMAGTIPSGSWLEQKQAPPATRPYGSVVGTGSRDEVEVGTQVRTPPWPDAARHVRPVLYVAFCASGSAFQRWPEGTRYKVRFRVPYRKETGSAG